MTRAQERRLPAQTCEMSVGCWEEQAEKNVCGGSHFHKIGNFKSSLQVYNNSLHLLSSFYVLVTVLGVDRARGGHCDRADVMCGLRWKSCRTHPFWHHAHLRKQGLSSRCERRGCKLGAHWQAGPAIVEVGLASFGWSKPLRFSDYSRRDLKRETLGLAMNASGCVRDSLKKKPYSTVTGLFSKLGKCAVNVCVGPL